MGKYQRQKGHSFERWVANRLSARLGRQINRNIGQARDGGDDITVSNFRIECKRRRKIGVYPWFKQVQETCRRDELPIVVLQADYQEPLALIPLEALLDYIDICLTNREKNNKNEDL